MKYLVLFITSVSCFIAIFSLQTVFAADCVFDVGDISDSFKNCNPSIGLDPNAGLEYEVQESGSDFRIFIATAIERIQIITAIIAIGVIVWIGF